MGPAIVAALAVVIGGVLAAIVSTRELRLRRQLESTQLFVALFATAHGYRPDSPSGLPVGRSEQITAIWLVAEFGRRHRWLREPARRGLSSIGTWDKQVSDPLILQAAEDAGKLLG
jgi:hypothetical protein